jgi:hypothetical protein
MCLVGLHMEKLATTGIVKVEHCLRIAVPPLDAGKLLGILIGPDAILVAEGVDSALFTYSCS